MTKKELLAALVGFPDDAEIMVAYTYEGNTVLEGLADANANGPACQLTAESLAAEIARAWQDNLRQNAKVRARAEGVVDEREWRRAQRRRSR